MWIDIVIYIRKNFKGDIIIPNNMIGTIPDYSIKQKLSLCLTKRLDVAFKKFIAFLNCSEKYLFLSSTSRMYPHEDSFAILTPDLKKISISETYHMITETSNHSSIKWNGTMNFRRIEVPHDKWLLSEMRNKFNINVENLKEIITLVKSYSIHLKNIEEKLRAKEKYVLEGIFELVFQEVPGEYGNHKFDNSTLRWIIWWMFTNLKKKTNKFNFSTEFVEVLTRTFNY